MRSKERTAREEMKKFFSWLGRNYKRIAATFVFVVEAVIWARQAWLIA